MCTAPVCPAFGVLQCGSSAGCPGGCGTVCTIPTRDPNLPVQSRVVLRLTTGDDGTHDNPTLQLIGRFAGSPYELSLDNPDDLQPGLSDFYDVSVPFHFCDLTAFRLLKPGDDDWSLVTLSLDIADTPVYFLDNFSALNPITATTAVDGGWDDTYFYTQYCTP